MNCSDGHTALVVSLLKFCNGKKKNWKKRDLFLWMQYSAALSIKTEVFIKENPSDAWATFLLFQSVLFLHDSVKVSEWQQLSSTLSLWRYACMCVYVWMHFTCFVIFFHVCVHVQPAGSLATCWRFFFFSSPYISALITFTNLSGRYCCCSDWSWIKPKRVSGLACWRRVWASPCLFFSKESWMCLYKAAGTILAAISWLVSSPVSLWSSGYTGEKERTNERKKGREKGPTVVTSLQSETLWFRPTVNSLWTVTVPPSLQ